VLACFYFLFEKVEVLVGECGEGKTVEGYEVDRGINGDVCVLGEDIHTCIVDEDGEVVLVELW
jgi:hypothetical protein